MSAVTCPRCGRTTHHPTLDPAAGYCAVCGAWTGIGAHRLIVTHDVPADERTIMARATMARAVHSLAVHGQLDLIAEQSHPAWLSWTMQASEQTRAGLLIVAQTLPTGSGWSVRWEVER